MAALLAPAMGIALSPFGIIPAILLQFTATPRANGAAFLVGWSTGVLAGFLLAAAASDAVSGLGSGAALDWLRLVAGVALLMLGLWRWRQRKAAAGAMPGWMAGIADSNPRGALRLGVVLSLANPKVLLLAAGAGLAVSGGGGAPGSGLVGAGLLFAAASALLVALPLLLPLLFGRAVLAPLDRARQWLIAHNGAITAAMLLAFGILLVMKGAGALG